MLLYIIFLVLRGSEGVIGSGDSCGASDYEACQNVSWSFPKSEAELDRMCPQIAYHFDCEKDYSDRCEFYDDLAEERFREVRDLVEDICRKDSPLHLGIVRNMDCLNEVIEVDFKVCYNYMRSKARVMMDYIRNMEFEAGYEGYLSKGDLLTSFSCLTDLFKNACLTSKTSDRCGSDVKDIAIEVLTRENRTYRVCSDSSDERLEELLSLLNLDSQEKAFLNIFLHKG